MLMCVLWMGVQITVLDLRLANTDRNGSNILVRERLPEELPHARGRYELIPIDHGYALPHTLQVGGHLYRVKGFN